MRSFSNAEYAWPKCNRPLGDGAKRNTGRAEPDMASKALKTPAKRAWREKNETASVAKKSGPRKAKGAKPLDSGTQPALRPARLIDCEASLAENTARLLAQDHEFVSRLIEIAGRPPMRRQEPGFAGMVSIIVSQQVSVASARAIYRRVETNLAPLSPERVLAADDAALRECGLSLPKMRALRALAHAVEHDGLDLVRLGELEAEAAHRALVAVKGIGPWTADIFLLFCLGHPDAFPSGDLALQEAARLALALKKRPDARQLETIAEKWRPVRGVAARLLWAYYHVAKRRAGIAMGKTMA
jgi:DNA-3-methyladenine glycosylase II